MNFFEKRPDSKRDPFCFLKESDAAKAEIQKEKALREKAEKEVEEQKKEAEEQTERTRGESTKKKQKGNAGEQRRRRERERGEEERAGANAHKRPFLGQRQEKEGVFHLFFFTFLPISISMGCGWAVGFGRRGNAQKLLLFLGKFAHRPQNAKGQCRAPSAVQVKCSARRTFVEAPSTVTNPSRFIWWKALAHHTAF